MRRCDVRALMYHDVTDVESLTHHRHGRDSYGVSLSDFAAHLRALGGGLRTPPSLVRTGEQARAGADSWAITFDDGLSSVVRAARLLEALGWRAHVFVVTEWLGQPSYLTPEDVVALDLHGHVIGTHSHTHPKLMSALTYGETVEEWGRSSRILSDLLGRPITTASVPGGFYSSSVAAAAAEAGISVLFTSEPATRLREVDGCAVVGRYVVRASTRPASVAGLAAGDLRVCGAQWASWNAKKVAKRVLGGRYYTARDWFVRIAYLGRG